MQYNKSVLGIYMVSINCSGKSKEEKVVIEFNNQDNRLNIADNCVKVLTPSFMQSVLEQVIANSEKEKAQHHSYTMEIDNDVQATIKYHTLNPSLFELSASKIAHYLFPNNFAEYKFIIKTDMDVNQEIDAGYLLSAYKESNCNTEHLDGIEAIYATALYLGLEIRSHKCITSEDKSYLFIDDFSHSFHRIDVKQNQLVDEYRDHKILPSQKGILFPDSFLNEKCGEWIDRNCDVAKLKNAYEKIINTPQDEIDKIIDASIHVLQSIECANSEDNSCTSNDHYQYMYSVKEVLSSNHESISSLMINVEL